METLERILEGAKDESGRMGAGFLAYLGIAGGSIIGALGPAYDVVYKMTESPLAGALAATACFAFGCYSATRAGKELAKR